VARDGTVLAVSRNPRPATLQRCALTSRRAVADAATHADRRSPSRMVKTLCRVVPTLAMDAHEDGYQPPSTRRLGPAGHDRHRRVDVDLGL
jgi:hypothetical protein